MSYDQEADYRAFMECLPELLSDEDKRGKYVVIHNLEVVAIRRTEDNAIAFAAKKYGMEQFIVQEIIEQEPSLMSYSMLV